ncbi:MAG: hypothetical protein IT201_08420 [Thermoleophilia bacterium]|nr:hypothetical protein [Thermoleophilia bacterium]
MKAGKVALITTGSLAGMLAAALLAGAVWLFDLNTDSVGYVVTDTHEVATATYALATNDLDVEDDFGWLYDRGPKLRVRGESDKPLFIGIARSEDVERYLAGVAHEEVTELDVDHFALTTERQVGTAGPAAPASQTFWATSTQGAGVQTLEWDGGYEQWSVVVMNADASPGVDVSLSLGAHVPHLTWIAIGGAIGGGLLVVAAVGLILLGARIPDPSALARTPAAPVA